MVVEVVTAGRARAYGIAGLRRRCRCKKQRMDMKEWKSGSNHRPDRERTCPASIVGALLTLALTPTATDVNIAPIYGCDSNLLRASRYAVRERA